MYTNPYLNNFNGFREPNQQQPIQNIFTSQVPTQDLFMARFLKENERPEEMYVNQKTAFISIKNKELIIKDTNGELTKYGLIPPRDEKDEKIEELQKQIMELKGMMLNESNANATTNGEIEQPDGNVKKSNRK